MSFVTPDVRPSAIARVNPVAKLIAALLLGAALMLSIDWVSAAVALVLEAALIAWAGLN
ncbi:MAG: energy-coupling factor transport system permease protein, partial [Microbacteriaceae bacterium]|nr:energy-coupling factor transport system permease protein [Microbacteriaceae bacterium]